MSKLTTFFGGGVGGNISITHHYHDEIHSDLHSKDTKSEFVPEKLTWS